MHFGYFDNAATTELCEPVRQAMIRAMDCFGNPSSLYDLGIHSQQLVESARRKIAVQLKAKPNEIIFTSGGTEADNLAIFGAVSARKRLGNRVVTTGFEHAAVRNSMAELQRRGFEVVYLPPNTDGTVAPEAFEQAINQDTILVSVMQINNETGAYLPVERLSRIIREKQAPALLHCDAVQGFGKYSMVPEKCGIDLMTISAHKIHGPKGIGALYIRNGVRILPQLFGGEQQNGLRPGTEPVILIAGFGAAVDVLGNLRENEQSAARVKAFLIQKLSELPDVIINSPSLSSAYILNVSVLGLKSETLLHFLERDGIYVSAGSACAKGKASAVIQALGYDRRRADSVLRISMSRYSTVEEAQTLVDGILRAQQTLIHTKK